MNATSLAEGDLHQLVDNRLESDRRAEVLRRLALSPADRARVEAWREQNELIRSAFGGITHEALPPVLDIAPAKHVHCITQVDPLTLEAPRLERARRGAAMLATILLIAAGLGVSWLSLNAGKREGIAAAPLRGTIDAAVASRASQALGDDTRMRQSGAGSADDALPTTIIPDLTQSGFNLTSVESDTTAPASLVFHYRNADAERLVISVARAQGGISAAPIGVGRTFSWHRHDKAYAIVGTIAPERLRDIALSLQDDPGQE